MRALLRTAILLCWVICGQIWLQADSCNPIATFADGKRALREIFVSPTGNNSSGTGSRGSPFQTIGRALQGVRAGDAIRLLPGVYPGGHSVANLTGTIEAPIWLGGEPGQERPVIRGGSTGIQLSRARYVVLENMELSGATGNGINCDDGGEFANREATHHVLFRNLLIHDVGTGGNQDGLKLSGVNGYFVLDCEFARISAGGSGIDHVGCHEGLIARCTFTDMGSNGIQCKGGSEDIEIRWNRFHNGGGRAINIGGSTGFQFFRPPLESTGGNFEAKNIRVVANLFRGSDAPIAFVGAIQSLVANNTLVEPGRWVVRILQETVSASGFTFLPCGNNQFINNLVYYNRAQISTHVNTGANTDPSSFEFAHNLWFAFNQPSQSRPSLPVAERNGLYGLNPLFLNIGTGDWSVPENSPAAGKGRKLPNVPADLLERCFADPPGIGAFEAKPPPPAPSSDLDGDLIPDAWEQANGLDRLNPADAALDADADGFSNLGEYLAGTDPSDATSRFTIHAPQIAGGFFSFRYATVTRRVYHVEFKEPLLAANWAPASVTSGTGTPQEFRELATNKVGAKSFRVRVELADADLALPD